MMCAGWFVNWAFLKRILVALYSGPGPEPARAGSLGSWAAEQPRNADYCRGLAGVIVPLVLSEFHVQGLWPQGMQEVVLNAAMQTCRGAFWAVDPSLSMGLLSAFRVAVLLLRRSRRWSRRCSWRSWLGLLRLMCAGWVISRAFLKLIPALEPARAGGLGS
jgi:hypothetical protein